MIICCDIDNTINNLTQKTIELYNNRFGKSLSVDELTAYDFYECLSKDEADNLVSLFKDKNLWDSLRPVSGSKVGVQKLIDNGHRVIFSTATDPCNFAWKVQWMKDWFPFVNSDNIIRIMDKSLIRCDVIIDDDMNQLIHHYADRICLNHSWNQQSELRDEAFGIKRCSTWDEIVTALY